MKRCLIVDDSSVIRKVAKRILAGPQMLVVEAASGEEAVGMCAAEMPDVIIVDGVLPDMEAADFISRIRQIDSAEKTPKIAICIPEMDIGAIMRSKRAGAAGYIMKPFDRPILMERFRSLQAAA
jgi:two-component system chemotaxis response regulator CheY